MSEIFDLLVFYLNGLWKRRVVIVLVAWLVAIPGWLVVASMPSIYEASSRIYVDTSSVLQPLLSGIAVQSNVQTKVQMMKQTLLSRPNLEEVVHKTDYALLVNTDAEMEALVDSIQSRTTVESTKQDVFSISIQDTKPQRAKDVVQALLTIFVESNLGVSRKDLDTAEGFLDQQIADYEARLEDAENKLARFKQEHMDVALGGQGGYLGSATAANDQAKQLEQDLNVAIAQRNLLNKELASIPATLAAPLTNGGPPDDTDAQIVNLEAKLRVLLSEYTEKHPDVVTTKRQLNALLEKQTAAQAALAADPQVDAGESAVTYGEPNPVYDQVKMRVIEMDGQIESLRQRSAAARTQADALASKAQEVPQVEAEFQKLNRDYGIIKARHEELLTRRESARMSRSRDDIGESMQYKVIDPPTIASEPVGPNRALLLNIVAIGALGAGVGLAVVLMVLDTSFTSLTELRQDSGIPVIGAITDNRGATPGTRAFISHLALGCSFGVLVAILAGLLIVESNIGLDKVTSVALGDNFLGRTTNYVLQKASSLLSLVHPSSRP